jgi:hypothetical protein
MLGLVAEKRKVRLLRAIHRQTSATSTSGFSPTAAEKGISPPMR